ncbi:MAG: dihydrolipoyllysine-residue acetyltransferase [Azoarcus sp.]|jgi:pyruvate dehydrogenase E2 component (dihydrolipoamide acetyltransferase)|nr:dihydrolipoyllysine-residue acetyltransferase [Azoarcus sp.]
MSQLTEIKVPDIGDFSDVPIIEIYIKPGDTVALDDALVTLESDKATMDVPATASGVVREVLVKLGDRVSEGCPLIRVEGGLSAQKESETAKQPESPAKQDTVAVPASTPAQAEAVTLPSTAQKEPPLSLGGKVHASPSVRAYARELGADLSKVTPSGPNGRILREDVTAWVKNALTATPRTGAPGSGLDLLPWPKVDFSKFGDIEVRPLSRIQKISGQNLARNWVMIPAVTYHEEADITELEAFRIQVNKENEKTGNAKLTMLAFLIKASVCALQQFPTFNSSLDGDNLILKKYFHIGFAADTPNGLVVPVIKNADRKGILEIAQETGELARQAREGTLKPGDMQGAGFTISSLGGIGGTSFSPIINAPEAAILGVNKSTLKPVWDGKAFQPRLTLPLSLTADHRVVDGALATRFNVCLAQLLADFRRVTL